MLGTAFFFTVFGLKKNNIRSLADFQEKTLMIERQFFQNETVFNIGTYFVVQREQNLRFQTTFQGKAHIIERQFSQNVTVFMLDTTSFFNWFLVKREQNVRFQADFQVKPLIKEQFFQIVVVLCYSYILFFRLFFVKKTKRGISDRFSKT